MTPNSLSEFSSFCPSSLSWDRRGLSGFSFSPSRLRFQDTGLVSQVCVHRVPLIRIHALHWHEHGVVANVGVRFSVDDFVVNRVFTEVASCVSGRFSPQLDLEAPGITVVSGGSSYISSLPLAALWMTPSRFSCISGTTGRRARGSAAGGMSKVVDLGFFGVSRTA